MTERQPPAAQETEAPPAFTPQPPSYESHQLNSGVIVRDFEPHSCVSNSNPEPEADNQLPSYASAAASGRWGRYKSEEAYLDALRKFVRDKDYVDGGKDINGNPVGVIGFYGSRTGSDYASGPGLRDGKHKSKAKMQDQDSQATAQRGVDGSDHILTGDYHGNKTGLQKWLQKKREKPNSK